MKLIANLIWFLLLMFFISNCKEQTLGEFIWFLIYTFAINTEVKDAQN